MYVRSIEDRGLQRLKDPGCITGGLWNTKGVKAKDTGEVLEVSGPFLFLLHAVADVSVRFLQSYFHLLPVCLWQLSEMGRAPALAPPLQAAPRKPHVRAVPSSSSSPPSHPPSHRSREMEAGSSLTQEASPRSECRLLPSGEDGSPRVYLVFRVEAESAFLGKP